MRISRLRCENELYPDYTDAIEIIDNNGISTELLSKIILKHKVKVMDALKTLKIKTDDDAPIGSADFKQKISV